MKIISVVVALLTFVALVGCTTASDPVSGVVESVEVKHSIPAGTDYSSYDAWKEPNFVAITIVDHSGTTHYVALPETFNGVHEIRSGDEIVAKLGRTAFRSTLQEHLIKEEDGVVRVLESTTVGWRLIETYKIKERLAPEAK
ncbi:MAG: hypothetical protein A3D65_06735 [Candidatus Lloydbacteria bacterium RIFCSPHIGHO2_02_FULL_50_13]|uniref:DUF5666 domain-containing protein n=1 Tax=Candidatus Lloydbacteria bacterium RIFCSPHIGHO2_02_FULL_50_13 TaxID=1798661 RepID=A0A1G2CZK9_9BACT|nr:MAG: hypothetical protein A3D65_06735 [Candidatus Lloydbacteria bacterium RIFCSPHIGHO2_02_FULL_50_13]